MLNNPERHRLQTAATLLAAGLVLTACAQDQPLADESREVPGGAVGPDLPVTDDLKLLQVQLEFPLDGVYDEGEDARLFLAISNTSTVPGELVDVRGPDFGDAALLVDGAKGAIPVPENDNVYVGAEGAPSIVLQDLQRSLHSSQSIPVTFVFEDAPEVTVEVPVAAAGQNPTPTYDFPDPAEDVDPS